MRFIEGIDYRVIPKAERNGKPYKYELLKQYALGVKIMARAKVYSYILLRNYRLSIAWGYRWNGSNVVFDTKACMRAAAVHDALCQLINEGKLDPSYRKYADQLYRDIMIEDGAWKWWANARYRGLRIWAGLKSLWPKGESK